MLSPSPSPPSDANNFFDGMQLAHPHGHHMHPSLLYHPDPAYPSSSSSPLSLPPSESPPPQMNGKRYRSAPAKSFQCAGYGECRMVFSRSEHLARHIRKHTGERPFACHCTKQFSRLDNLRQHAQTVHSAPEDKPLNERMMRALAGVNASMMAGVRGRRRYGGDSSSSSHSSYPSSSPYTVGSSPYGNNDSGSGSGSASPLPSPPYSAPSFAGAPDYTTYSAYGESPLPSPSFGSFPGSSSPYAHPSSYHYGGNGNGTSPFSSPSLYSPSHSCGEDYLAAGSGAVRVKQEEMDEREMELEGFYAALESSPPLPLSLPHGGQGLNSYASSSSLSSASSASSSSSASASSASSRPDTAQAPPRQQSTQSTPGQQQYPHPASYARSHSSASSASSNSSPAGSPCVGTFWDASSSAAQSQCSSAPIIQGQGLRRQGGARQGQGEYLPSPPQSPSFYASSHPSSHPQGQQGQGPFGWTPTMRAEEGEMSNAQYYAAVQSQHPHPHSPHQHPHQQAGQGEYFYAPQQGGYAVYA